MDICGNEGIKPFARRRRACIQILVSSKSVALVSFTNINERQRDTQRQISLFIYLLTDSYINNRAESDRREKVEGVAARDWSLKGSVVQTRPQHASKAATQCCSLMFYYNRVFFLQNKNQLPEFEQHENRKAT